MPREDRSDMVYRKHPTTLTPEAPIYSVISVEHQEKGNECPVRSGSIGLDKVNQLYIFKH